MLRSILCASALALAFTASGCSEPEPLASASDRGIEREDTNRCLIAPELRTRWADFDITQQEPGSRVYAYKGCGRELIFAAVAHTNDPQSATYAAVRAVFDAGPEIVLLEGFPWAAGENLQQLIDFAKQVEGTPGDNEAMFAIREAVARGVPFRGAEPSERVVFETAGLSARDIFGFYILRQLPLQVRSQAFTSLDAPEAQAFIDGFASQIRQAAGLDQDALADIDSVEEFRLWHLETNGMPLAENFDGSATAPASTVSNPLPTNAISDKVSDARDGAILTHVASAMQERSKVAIIYGASHLVVQRPALEAAFGEPASLFEEFATP